MFNVAAVRTKAPAVPVALATRCGTSSEGWPLFRLRGAWPFKSILSEVGRRKELGAWGNGVSVF